MYFCFFFSDLANACFSNFDALFPLGSQLRNVFILILFQLFGLYFRDVLEFRLAGCLVFGFLNVVLLALT